jgi:hypothetical protein
MNYRTTQLINRAIRKFTAFTSLEDFTNCALKHGYTPTIKAYASQCTRDKIRISAMANAFDERMEELGSAQRCYRGCQG